MNIKKMDKKTYKIKITMEDEFHAKYNSPECVWDNLLSEIFLTEEEIGAIEFCVRELIRIGGHSGNETLFVKMRTIIKKLKQ